MSFMVGMDIFQNYTFQISFLIKASTRLIPAGKIQINPQQHSNNNKTILQLSLTQRHSLNKQKPVHKFHFLSPSKFLKWICQISLENPTNKFSTKKRLRKIFQLSKKRLKMDRHYPHTLIKNYCFDLCPAPATPTDPPLLQYPLKFTPLQTTCDTYKFRFWPGNIKDWNSLHIWALYNHTHFTVLKVMNVSFELIC